MGANKPRNIRDIAHLYLSRSSRPVTGENRAILVAGIDGDCFPAFHVVNIAAALAARGYNVRLSEISDETLNAGFFLSLPARLYVDPPGGDVAVSALVRVTLTHAFAPPERTPRRETAARPVHLVHLPPVQRPAHTRALRDAIEVVGTGATVLYLGGGEPDVSVRDREGVRVCRVDVRGPRRPGEMPVRGRIDRWQGALNDPIPPVLRDPQSVLSRSYLTLCEALVSPTAGNEQRSRDDEPSRPARGVRAYRKTRSTPFRAR